MSILYYISICVKIHLTIYVKAVVQFHLGSIGGLGGARAPPGFVIYPTHKGPQKAKRPTPIFSKILNLYWASVVVEHYKLGIFRFRHLPNKLGIFRFQHLPNKLGFCSLILVFFKRILKFSIDSMF